jgi:hypothetical protein
MSQRRSPAKPSPVATDSSSKDNETRVYSAAVRLSGLVEVLWILIVMLTALVDPTSGSAAGSSQLLAVSAEIALVVAAVFLMVRAARRGLIVRGDAVISRGWLRTRTFPRESITLVGTAPYERVGMPGVAYDFQQMVIAVVDGERHDFRQVRGWKRTTNRRADQLREALGLGTPGTHQRSV